MHQIDLQASKSRSHCIQLERCQRFKGFENTIRKRYSETLRTKQSKGRERVNFTSLTDMAAVYLVVPTFRRIKNRIRDSHQQSK